MISLNFLRNVNKFGSEIVNTFSRIISNCKIMTKLFKYEIAVRQLEGRHTDDVIDPKIALEVDHARFHDTLFQVKTSISQLLLKIGGSGFQHLKEHYLLEKMKKNCMSQSCTKQSQSVPFCGYPL